MQDGSVVCPAPRFPRHCALGTRRNAHPWRARARGQRPAGSNPCEPRVVVASVRHRSEKARRAPRRVRDARDRELDAGLTHLAGAGVHSHVERPRSAAHGRRPRGRHRHPQGGDTPAEHHVRHAVSSHPRAAKDALVEQEAPALGVDVAIAEGPRAEADWQDSIASSRRCPGSVEGDRLRVSRGRSSRTHRPDPRRTAFRRCLPSSGRCPRR